MKKARVSLSDLPLPSGFSEIVKQSLERAMESLAKILITISVERS